MPSIDDHGSVQSPYAREAEAFVRIMRNLAPEVRLDFSVDSLKAVEAFIASRFDPPGSTYVGDSLIVASVAT